MAIKNYKIWLCVCVCISAYVHVYVYVHVYMTECGDEAAVYPLVVRTLICWLRGHHTVQCSVAAI